MKCPLCRECLEPTIINNFRVLYCWLDNCYYFTYNGRGYKVLDNTFDKDYQFAKVENGENKPTQPV